MTAIIVLLALVLTGCQASPTREAMQVKGLSSSVHRSAGDVVTAVMGATALSKTNPVRVTDEDFAQALTQSIEQAGLFRRVLHDGAAQYHLHAMVQRIDQDLFGMDMTASMEVKYVLVRMAPKGIVWEKTIRSSHTAGLNDSLISIGRVRVATEGASRKNIESALHDMAALALE